ncbi:kinetochore protein ndc8 [Nannochloropsis oceanica]
MALSRRRGTLEPLSSSGFNQRQSMGMPSRGVSRTSLGPNFDKQAKPQGGRLSLHPSSSSTASSGTSFSSTTASSMLRNSNAPPRKSSTGLSRKSTAYGSHARQDPRPNTDKSYIQTSIRGLINYLTDHNYDQPFSAKILQRPTAKDFTYIVSFLFRQVDANFRITGKLEEEVLQFFKAMHYPFPISKASMQAVGTMHTWPTLLASITWMVELLTYDEEVQNDAANQAALAGSSGSSSSVDDFERADEKALFEYLGKAYKAFLDGDDELYEKLEDGLVGSFEGRCGEVEAQCAVLEANIAQMQAEAQVCRTRHAALPGLRQRRADYESDLGKFRTLIEQLTAHREGLAAKVEKREGELAELYRSLEMVRTETAELKQVVAGQELSPEDVARMQQERVRLDEALGKAREHKGKMQKALWEAEMELSRAVVDLETAAQTFNGKAASLQLIPITARNSNGIQYEMSVSKGAVSASAEPQDLIGLDIKGVIRPSLGQIKNVILDKVHEARTSVLKMLDEEAKSEEEVAEAVAAFEVMEGKVKKQEEGYRSEKARMEANMAEKSADVERVEEQVLHLRSQVVVELESRAARNQQRLTQLQAELALEREEHEGVSKVILECIMGALHALADHKEEVKRRLEEFHEQCLQRRDHLLSLPEPFSPQ